LGYIGLPTASTFATHGLKVTGVDTNPEVIQGLNNGHVHLFEPGLRTLVQAALQSGNLVVRSKPEPAEAFIIAVPTLLKRTRKRIFPSLHLLPNPSYPISEPATWSFWNPPRHHARP
jgi:UDP-N-acetyl-D-mannosaminuronic acid dehydrogenase